MPGKEQPAGKSNSPAPSPTASARRSPPPPPTAARALDRKPLATSRLSARSKAPGTRKDPPTHARASLVPERTEGRKPNAAPKEANERRSSDAANVSRTRAHPPSQLSSDSTRAGYPTRTSICSHLGCTANAAALLSERPPSPLRAHATCNKLEGGNPTARYERRLSSDPAGSSSPSTPGPSQVAGDGHGA